ncbi:hypothetical protein GCM10009868_33250 [Terrabacter aerolatus]|uniref:DUF1707 domain-containing protein n=1 Tax=Terrabacter aerolatus TaxID=422442 RepID=A0A512CYD3_9MICO|nr:DUF1707 domain-containing protein [Terrabacter aerolatus]GEO29231.1 hypothetical protein TAE01_10410 [Terrabacter aerolatus]
MEDDGDIRIGTAEREEALAALAEHHAAGRLDADEYEDRRGRATDAIVRRELTSLFTDLPEPRPALRPVAAPGAGVTRAPNPGGTAPGRSARSRIGRTLVSLSPFIALAAFFTTKSWLAFLLVPIIAIMARALDD